VRKKENQTMDPKDRSKQLDEIRAQLAAQNEQLKALGELARKLEARGVVVPAAELEPLERLFERAASGQNLAIRLTAAKAANGAQGN
jgi:hypothetical protein